MEGKAKKAVQAIQREMISALVEQVEFVTKRRYD